MRAKRHNAPVLCRPKPPQQRVGILRQSKDERVTVLKSLIRHLRVDSFAGSPHLVDLRRIVVFHQPVHYAFKIGA